MKKRTIICFLILLLAVGNISCGKRTEIVKKEDKTIILNVLAGQSTSDAGLEDMIDEWLKKYFPEVRLEWECVDWGENFDAQMRARCAAGDVPDIIVGKAQDVKAYVSTGNLAPISAECTAAIKEEAMLGVTIDGIAYGLPFNAWYQGVIYNKKLFRSCGLEVPKTRSELEKAVTVLNDSEITPFASHYQESWTLGNTTMQFMMNEVFNAIPDWGDRFRRGEVNYSDFPAVRRCMEYNLEILNASWEDALYIDQYECDNRFTNQEAAMYLTGSWSLQFANQYNSGDEFGIFPYPNESGDSKLLRETNMTFMKSAGSDYGELIDEILKRLISDEQLQGEILDYTQTQPVVKEFMPTYRSCIQSDVEAYEKSGQVLDVTTGNTQLVWSFQNAVAEEQLQWLQGKKTLEEVLEYADSQRSYSVNE